MSKAFATEDSDISVQELARPISVHENFVTRRGLKLIGDMVDQLERERVAASNSDDTIALSRINRELRYWHHRKASARLIIPGEAPTRVRFGVTVTLTDEHNRRRTYTLVGEDEAHPADGLISWVSPVAQALLGKKVDDKVNLQGGLVRVVSLTTRADN